MPKISACIVAYCDYDEVCAAVRSILHYTPAPDLALYVVDNGSPDGCGRQLAETDFGDSRVTVLPLEKNIGFGKGHNYVLDRLTSDVHFILNPDILLTGDVLEDMAAWLLARPGAAMATPQLRYPDGKLQHLPRRKPTPWLLLARQLAPKLGGCFKKADDHYTMQDEDLTVPRRIEFCTGSFMAVRTDVFKEIGVFHVCGGRRPDPEGAAEGHRLAGSAVFRHSCVAPRPHARRRQVQDAACHHGTVFQKVGLWERDGMTLPTFRNL